MGEPVKGTVTSLSSVFAPEDAQKASVRVQEAISERQKEVQQLQAFLNDNTSLVNLVKKLPDQLHHDIMVPFGKAAFFPGRLIHTNEFMVLLGEGYYAERTSKQTVEILKRRGKDLESQIETLNAVVKDLKFEASFFDETATEAAEGIVEIREDYVDEASNEDKATTAGDDDFARILSRIDELEKEELESEIAEEGEEKEEADIEPGVRNLELKELPDIPVSKDSHVKVPTLSGSNIPVKLIEHNKSKESLPRTLVSRNEVSTLASNSSNASSKTSVAAPVSKEVSNFGSSSSNDRSMAFTGSIVERTHTIENSQKGQTPAPASKPVSRFKLQRK
ncbi:hypothetical protein L1987_57114 [Smallanthus sonchifolius]|uniref:Uncharacterized protein n=1 Tax=Smallanthus sonchifolius TaxID=185202 RepID=A0ACB9DCL2_9ASTR|nr:hypothetical protein L1987_57114 [Smallanthus sonchifolius]